MRGAGGAGAGGRPPRDGMLIMVAGSPSVSPAARVTKSATTSGVATSPALAIASSSAACASTAEANGPPRRSARVSQLTIAGCSGCDRPSLRDLLGAVEQRRERRRVLPVVDRAAAHQRQPEIAELIDVRRLA